jgi:hypothetical protein
VRDAGSETAWPQGASGRIFERGVFSNAPVDSLCMIIYGFDTNIYSFDTIWRGFEAESQRILRPRVDTIASFVLRLQWQGGAFGHAVEHGPLGCVEHDLGHLVIGEVLAQGGNVGIDDPLRLRCKLRGEGDRLPTA